MDGSVAIMVLMCVLFTSSLHPNASTKKMIPVSGFREVQLWDPRRVSGYSLPCRGRNLLVRYTDISRRSMPSSHDSGDLAFVQVIPEPPSRIRERYISAASVFFRESLPNETKSICESLTDYTASSSSTSYNSLSFGYTCPSSDIFSC